MENLFIGLQLTVTGMTVVFAGLILLLVFMNVFKRLDPANRNNNTRKDKSKAATNIAEIMPGAIPADVVIAIMAAVAVATSRRVVVKRIRYRTSPLETSWTRQGRISIMGSHTVKR
jgi:sodium pump decarboxylase gamma subunit